MPAAGILKKATTTAKQKSGLPPPPPPIIIHSGAFSNNSICGGPPPKPRRFLSRAADDRHLIYVDDDGEDEEQQTEDSYDYKDIDFAKEIYNFKPFPPRPKPPQKSTVVINGDISVMESIDTDKLNTNADQTVSVLTDEINEFEGEKREIYGDDKVFGHEIRMTSSEEDLAGNNLSRFFKEHEGRPLSVEDVERLERILDEVEKDGSFLEPNMRDPIVTNASIVHFGDAQILHGMTDDDRTTTDDYSEMEFQHAVVTNGTIPNLIRDYAGYEPIGQPDHLLQLKQLRPDMSDYVPPVPSTIVGDPFSWRRRGRRRFCDYGYNLKSDYWSMSALDKINDGCQDIEDRIVARDLTPPGTLLITLGSAKKKRKRLDVPSERPPPPLPPKLRRTPSPCCNVLDRASNVDLLTETNNELDCIETEVGLNDEHILANLESEIIPDEISEHGALNEQIVTDDIVNQNDVEMETTEAIINDNREIKITSEDSDFVSQSIDQPRRPPRRDVTPGHIPKSTDTEFGISLELPVDEIHAPKRSRRDAFEQRPPRPPPPNISPIRPLRNKRVRSADPLTTTEIFPHAPIQVTSTGHRPKRSSSFHTAEDIRRRIDIQAQNFLRIPRRREFTSTSTDSLKSDSLRQTRSPTPLYSKVNKGFNNNNNNNNKRESQKHGCSQLNLSDLENCSPTPPIPPPPCKDDVETAVHELNEWAEANSYLEDMAELDENTDHLPINRPLPAPPAPPRHRIGNKHDSKDEADFSSGVSIVFCNNDGGIVSGKMAVLSEMKVLRLIVGDLEASTLRVSQLDADRLRVASLENSPISGSSLPPSGPSGGTSGSSIGGRLEDASEKKDPQFDKPSYEENKILDAEGNFLPVTKLSNGEDDEDTDVCPTVVSQRENNIRIQTPRQHRDSEETVSLTTVSFDEDFDDATAKDDPYGTITSGTTSTSASYVTCDETLHNDDDVGLTDDLDDEFDFNLELEGDDEDPDTGCTTPTELEMDVTLGAGDCVGDDCGDGSDVDDVPMFTSSKLKENLNLGISSRNAPSPDSSSSSSGFEGIVKMRKMKLKGRLADNTNSWYDDGDVPGQVADNDVPRDHRRHHHRNHQLSNAAAENSLFESGTFVRPDVNADGNDYNDDDCSSDVDGGSLIKQRIAVLFESQSGGSAGSAGSCPSVRRPHYQHNQSPNSRRKSRPRRPNSKFYLSSEETQIPIEKLELDSPSRVDANDMVIESNVDGAVEGLTSNILIASEDVNGDIEESRLRSFSDDDEDEEDCSVASSSSPRNLSTYSDCAFVNEPIDGSSIGSTKYTRAFHIAKELMASEKVFVDVLNLLTKDFLEAIDKTAVKLRQPIIPEDVVAQILDCLPQLKTFNEDLLKDLEERIDNWNEIQQVSDVIVCKGPFLKLYTMYIKKFPRLTSNLDEACKKYPYFAQAVRDFEMSDRCKKLELKHYMLKPVQRIPQYRMLLQDYLKNIEPDSPDFADTEAALAIVSEVATHANDSMKEGDKFAKLLQIQSRVSGNHEVIKPGRIFIKEGELWKLCRKEMQLRTFVLFSDSLLHLSVTSQGLLRIHHELPLSNMQVSVPTQEDFQNEFSVISVARSFTLSARSPAERDEWISELELAIERTVTRHATFIQAKLHQLRIPEHRNKNEVLGQQAPVWVPDARVTMCQLCLHEFTLTFRRHHCRACGKVVCSICSANRAPLFYRKYEVARVCDECFVALKKEIEDRVSCNEEAFVQIDPDVPVLVPEIESTMSDEQKSRMPNLDDIKAQFKKYYRGGSSIDQKHKRQLPRVLKEVCANDTGSSMNGYLYKRVKRTWRRGWFVIKNKVLYTYRASHDVAALDSTPLLGFEVITFTEARDGIDHQLIFELRHPGYPSMEFYADSLKSAEKWLVAVRKATVLE